MYQPSAEGLTIGKGTGTLTFQFRDATGLRVEKRFYFQPDGKRYLVNVEATVDVNGAAKPVTIHGGAGIGLGYSLNGASPAARRADAGRQGGATDGR